MKNIKWYSVVGVTVVVLVTTMFIRVPLPSKGYFNFGDVAVVFAGLLLGRKFGAFAGGVGSALADVLGGFAIFAPLTFVAKGLEGLLAGFAKGKQGVMYHLFPLLGVISMAAIYFLGETFVAQYGGIATALSEVAPNLIQAAGGYIGGKLLFEMYARVFEKKREQALQAN